MKTITKILSALLILTFAVSACTYEDGMDIGDSTGQGGSLARYAIVGETMYYVDHSTLGVYDLSDPENPTFINEEYLTWNGGVETIFHHNSLLYIGSENGMFIYDISEPHTPVYQSMATHVSGCDPVVSDGKYAYVTVRNSVSCNRWSDLNILEIYDVSDPQNPIELSTTEMVEPIGLALTGDRLFVCDDSLKLFDVSNPERPVQIKAFPSNNAHDIIIRGDHVITVNSKGIDQYLYDSAAVTLTHMSEVIYK